MCDVRTRKTSVSVGGGLRNVTSKDAAGGACAHQREEEEEPAVLPLIPQTFTTAELNLRSFFNISTMTRGLCGFTLILILIPLTTGTPFQHGRFQGNAYSGTDARQRNK